MSGALTDQELAALTLLARAVSVIRALPECHPGDDSELVLHFHAVQNMVMARAAVRAHPRQFVAVEGFE